MPSPVGLGNVTGAYSHVPLRAIDRGVNSLENGIGTADTHNQAQPVIKTHRVISIVYLSPTPEGKDLFNRVKPPPGPIKLTSESDIYEINRVL